MSCKLNRCVLAVALAIATAATAHAEDKLAGRAVLPADTFAPGPTSGQHIGGGANGKTAPFIDKQPVQGFSAVLSNGDGTFWAMADNGYGALENSADFNLRLYRIRPEFETRRGGSGEIAVLGFIELHDPERKIPFAISNHFSQRRVLTGADFDIESIQRAADGTLWFGDEFGPFLLHTDGHGKVLEAPIALPDFASAGKEVRAPQNPFNEEASALRVMNALQAHAARHGARIDIVFSPDNALLADANPNTFAPSRNAPPPGSGLAPASSEIFDVAQLKTAGYPTVPYTVNDKARMLELMKLGVAGLISDRSDLLYQAVQEFDANGDGVAGDYLDADGLIDPAKFDAQGHRGSRNLRPENTLPAMEAGLDNLMNTLETDNGITRDGVPVLSHDPHIQAQKCRRSDGLPYTHADEVLIKDLTLAEIQSQFICDKLFRGTTQLNDPALSPVSVAFAQQAGLPNIYAVPSTQQLFDFVTFYAEWYQGQPGEAAAKRAKNAARVRFNIETKINPRAEFAARTTDYVSFAQKVGGVIAANHLEERADIQSFDFRTLLEAHQRLPKIRTVALFGDFPIFADRTIAGSDEGTNLQPDASGNTPWMAGLKWPYRVTKDSAPSRAQGSGGFEGMAISPDAKKLYTLLEKPLAGDDAKTLLIHEFDIAARRYTGRQFKYLLDARGAAIGDFILYNKRQGLVIERDNTQGDLNGFKKIFKLTFDPASPYVQKEELVDLMAIKDPRRISEPGQPGDVGLGRHFAFPFVTIEDVVVIDEKTIGVINDNNYPFSVGRHQGTKQPDDTEFILIKLDRPLKLEKD